MIYVDFEIPKTPREFLQKLFSIKWGHNYVSTVATYSNKECTITQCYRFRRRSFDDILECTQTYFKKITPKELFKILLTLNIKDINGRDTELYLFNCSSIKRGTMLYSSNIDDIKFNTMISMDKYDSKYSWKELFEMLEITSDIEYKKFISDYKNNVI